MLNGIFVGTNRVAGSHGRAELIHGRLFLDAFFRDDLGRRLTDDAREKALVRLRLLLVSRQISKVLSGAETPTSGGDEHQRVSGAGCGLQSHGLTWHRRV